MSSSDSPELSLNFSNVILSLSKNVFHGYTLRPPDSSGGFLFIMPRPDEDGSSLGNSCATKNHSLFLKIFISDEQDHLY